MTVFGHSLPSPDNVTHPAKHGGVVSMSQHSKEIGKGGGCHSNET